MTKEKNLISLSSAGATKEQLEAYRRWKGTFNQFLREYPSFALWAKRRIPGLFSDKLMIELAYDNPRHAFQHVMPVLPEKVRVKLARKDVRNAIQMVPEWLPVEVRVELALLEPVTALRCMAKLLPTGVLKRLAFENVQVVLSHAWSIPKEWLAELAEIEPYMAWSYASDYLPEDVYEKLKARYPLKEG